MLISVFVHFFSVFNQQNVDLSRPLIAMCYRGITGCALSAAAELLGKHDTPLYYVSLTPWLKIEQWSKLQVLSII